MSKVMFKKVAAMFKRTCEHFVRQLFIGFLIYLIGGFPTLVYALPQDGQIVSGNGGISKPLSLIHI